MTEATIAIGAHAALHIRTLPGGELWAEHIPTLTVHNGGLREGVAVAEVQLLEDIEYAYEFSIEAARVEIDSVLFNPSDSTGRQGRLRPGRAVGTITARVRAGDLSSSFQLEVRSRKLDYLTEYRWMVQRIAEESAEAAQSHFAASELSAFSPGSAGTAETLYQRFAFVASVIQSREFEAALELITRRPHVDYRVETTRVDPSRGLRASSLLPRALTRPGPRNPYVVAGLPSLPIRVEQVAHFESTDTVPNRFVKFALESWRALADDVARACRLRRGQAAERGVVEAESLAAHIDDLLRRPLFQDLSRLTELPVQSTVLRGRPGYRDVLRAYLQAEAAALVDWSGSVDAFAAGQRDVAALYEYWAFLELVTQLGACTGILVDKSTLFRRDADGLSLELRRGGAALVRGAGVRRGRSVSIELWFNRAFGPGESWTEPIRPDCSLMISATFPNRPATRKWLHFDAKYRVSGLREIFSMSDSPAVARPMSDDLLKMHAYRDAIKRTTGAYVLYPGFDEHPVRHTAYHEILPGLGAFVLRPTDSGSASAPAALSLRQFIDDAIDHVAAAGTDEDRASYWTHLTYDERRGRRLAGHEWLTKPPSDSRVLLGFVKGPEHVAWIQEQSQYNLRADDRTGSVDLSSPELASEFVYLYDAGGTVHGLYRATGALAVRTASELADSGYPHPRGELYCCLLLGERLPLPAIGEVSIRDVARGTLPASEWGRPVVVRLSDILRP